MNRGFRLSGLLAALLFALTVLVLASFVDDYSHVSQTVSEIGEAGSPVAIPFLILSLFVDLLLLAFSWSVLRFARAEGLPVAPAWFIACFALADIGTAVFPSPHPLHNVFGLSLVIGYMAPLVMALRWRPWPPAASLVNWSWVGWILVMIAIGLNLSPLFAPELYPLRYYGLVQRGLLVAFYGWLGLASLWLYRIRARIER